MPDNDKEAQTEDESVVVVENSTEEFEPTIEEAILASGLHRQAAM